MNVLIVACVSQNVLWVPLNQIQSKMPIFGFNLTKNTLKFGLIFWSKAIPSQKQIFGQITKINFPYYQKNQQAKNSVMIKTKTSVSKYPQPAGTHLETVTDVEHYTDRLFRFR